LQTKSFTSEKRGKKKKIGGQGKDHSTLAKDREVGYLAWWKKTSRSSERESKDDLTLPEEWGDLDGKPPTREIASPGPKKWMIGEKGKVTVNWSDVREA